MQRDDLNKILSILTSLQEVQKRLERDCKEVGVLLNQLQELVVDFDQEARMVRQEIKFFSDINRRIQDFGLVRKIMRRIPDVDFLIREEQKSQKEVLRQAKKVEDTVHNFQKFFQNLDSKR
jgi:hypothetical protein